MRLTLRTLLAYLDKSLNEQDAEEMGKKIEQSEFASGLAERVRRVIRRQGLAAPKVDGAGFARDANSVAEYLDSSIPSDRMGDFERVCLEFDVHLAEVAACHQILTLVLGKPVQIDAQLKERVYRVGKSDIGKAEARRPQTGPPATPAGQAPAQRNGEQSAKRKELMPEMAETSGAPLASSVLSMEDRMAEMWDDPSASRASSRGVLPILLMAAAAIIVLVLGLRAMGEFDSEHPIVRLFSGAEVRAPVPNSDAVAQISKKNAPQDQFEPNDLQTRAGQPVKSQSGDPQPVEPQPGEPQPGDPRPGDPRPVELQPVDRQPGDGQSGEPQPSEPQPSEPQPGEPQPGETGETSDPEDPLPTAPAPVPTDPEGGAGDTPPSQPNDVGAQPARPSVGEFVSNSGVALQPEDPFAAMRGEPLERPAAAAEPTSAQLLLRRTPRSNDWERLEYGAALSSDDRLLAPPGFRVHLKLNSHVQATLVGPTLVEVTKSKKSDISIRVHYGKIILANLEGQDTSVALQFRKKIGKIVFHEAQAAALVEARLWRIPGYTPKNYKNRMPVIVLSAFQGKSTWSTGLEVSPLSAENLLVYVNGQRRQTPPSWEAANWVLPATEDRQSRAAAELVSQIGSQPSIVEALSKAAQGRFADHGVESASLAAQCLAYLDRPRATIRTLNQTLFRDQWKSQLTALQHALARGPDPDSQGFERETDSTARVVAALEAEGQGHAQVLARLLVGYNRQTFDERTAAQLISLLESESLAVRVLALYNLWQVTGIKLGNSNQDINEWNAKVDRIEFNYQPEQLEYLNREIDDHPEMIVAPEPLLVPEAP